MKSQWSNSTHPDGGSQFSPIGLHLSSKQCHWLHGDQCGGDWAEDHQSQKGSQSKFNWLILYLEGIFINKLHHWKGRKIKCLSFFPLSKPEFQTQADTRIILLVGLKLKKPVVYFMHLMYASPNHAKAEKKTTMKLRTWSS